MNLVQFSKLSEGAIFFEEGSPYQKKQVVHRLAYNVNCVILLSDIDLQPWWSFDPETLVEVREDKNIPGWIIRLTQ